MRGHVPVALSTGLGVKVVNELLPLRDGGFWPSDGVGAPTGGIFRSG